MTTRTEYGHLPLDVFVGETEIDSGCIDVPMPQLFLENVQAASAVQEVDG